MKSFRCAVAVASLLCLPRSAGAATFTTLYNFSANGKQLPYYPTGQLTHFGDALFGVTLSDGPCNGFQCGTIFHYILPRNHLERLHVFTGTPDGGFPVGGFCALDGRFYGTTQYGGSVVNYGAGTIYQFDPLTDAEKVLYRFPSDEGQIDHPSALITDGTSLFGTLQVAVHHGHDSRGALFQYDLTAKHFHVLHQFATKFGSSDGITPVGPPVLVGRLLFGLTQFGGAGKPNLGTIYNYNTVSGHETVVHSFDDTPGNGNQPADHLVKQDFLLYGISLYGGAQEGGTFFSFDPRNNAFHVLHEFGVSAGDGAMPENAPLYSNGLFYGTTRMGGTSGAGVIYSLDPVSGNEMVLWSFATGEGGQTATPVAVNGVLYGTTFDGGTSQLGSIYQLVP